jgi:hypothetical protein
MSFRPFSLDVCFGGLALFVFLACAGSSRAEDAASRPIEIVPSHGKTIDTNSDQFHPIDSRKLDPLVPRGLQSFQADQPVVLPRPAQQNAPSQSERDLLDRRRNWVFMTPEEFSGQTPEKDISIVGETEANGNRPITAMQRYYQRLYDSDHSIATNQFSKSDAAGWNTATNSVGPGFQNNGGSTFVTSSFNPIRDAEVFRATRPTVFSDIFGSSDTDSGTPSPESVRLKAQQKEHMDNFKELWNIDQPAAAPISTPAPTVVSGSGSVFGTPDSQSSFRPLGLPETHSSRGGSTPFQPTVPSPRTPSPPRADFTPPQRPF